MEMKAEMVEEEPDVKICVSFPVSLIDINEQQKKKEKKDKKKLRKLKGVNSKSANRGSKNPKFKPYKR
jgi:hypothetical protein